MALEPKIKNQVSPNGGFIALISAIIISAVMIVLTVALSFSNFLARFNVLDAEFKERSLGLAEACGDIALLNLANNPAYSPANEFVNLGGSDACTVVSLQNDIPAAGQTTIKTQGVFPQAGNQRAFTNLRIVANSTSLNLISWEETPN